MSHDAPDAARGRSSAWFPFGLRNVAAAVPTGFLALSYLVVATTRRPALGWDPEWLGRLMQIEFLAIHSFPFMAMIAWRKPESDAARKVQWTAFTALLTLYVVCAAVVIGWRGVIVFFSLCGITYLGWLLGLRRTSSGASMALRWAVISCGAFMLAAGVTRMPEEADQWHTAARVHVFGALYFGALALERRLRSPRAPHLARLPATAQIRVTAARAPHPHATA